MSNITGLDLQRFEKARRQAEDQIRASAPMPDRARYTAGSFSKHPPAVTAGALLALTVVALAMFWISAGKAIVAADLTLAPMVESYGRLTPSWLNWALVGFILAGEVGTIIFTTGRALLSLSGSDRRWLTLAALACAAGALIANVSVTALHPETIAGLPVFGWFLSIMPPAIVLAVGLFIEKLLVSSLEARSAARAAYESALAEWRERQEAPADHPDFRKFWYLSILDQLMRVSSSNRAKIQAAIEADPGVRLILVTRELRRHEWAEAVPAPPDLPRIEQVEHLALPGGVQADDAPEDEDSSNVMNSLNTLNGPAVQRALAWLESQAEAPTSVREAAQAAGVSVGTMHAALRRRGGQPEA